MGTLLLGPRNGVDTNHPSTLKGMLWYAASSFFMSGMGASSKALGTRGYNVWQITLFRPLVIAPLCLWAIHTAGAVFIPLFPFMPDKYLVLCLRALPQQMLFSYLSSLFCLVIAPVCLWALHAVGAVLIPFFSFLPGNCSCVSLGTSRSRSCSHTFLAFFAW
jgi:hypothetical protein